MDSIATSASKARPLLGNKPFRRLWAARGRRIDRRHAERLVRANRWLNRRVEHHLRRGVGLERAFDDTRRDALFRLKRVLVHLVGLSI